MYIKISDDRVIEKKNIIAILDIRQISGKIIFKENKDDKYKSIIILDDNGEEKRLFSCASPQTLLNRAMKSHF